MGLLISALRLHRSDSWAIVPGEITKPTDIEYNISELQIAVVRDKTLKLPDGLKKIAPDEIDLTNLTDQQYIADLGSVQRSYYPESEPGGEFIIDLPVHYNCSAAEHLASTEIHRNRIGWIKDNIYDFIRGLEKPEIIEKRIRQRNDGHFSLTNIVQVSSPGINNWDYMVISISLSKGDSQYHQITTIHPIRYKELFKANSQLRDKYILVK